MAKRPTENELSDFSQLWHGGCDEQSTRHNVWTEITRPKYERAGQRYASDLTDAEWALIEPHMPAVKRLGRPRATDLRAGEKFLGGAGVGQARVRVADV
jgi:hypothetical protein